MRSYLSHHAVSQVAEDTRVQIEALDDGEEVLRHHLKVGAMIVTHAVQHRPVDAELDSDARHDAAPNAGGLVLVREVHPSPPVVDLRTSGGPSQVSNSIAPYCN